MTTRGSSLPLFSGVGTPTSLPAPRASGEIGGVAPTVQVPVVYSIGCALVRFASGEHTTATPSRLIRVAPGRSSCLGPSGASGGSGCLVPGSRQQDSYGGR